ncbi:hypothetical protein IE077_002651, partial [Cardiosporidium cionae]
CTETLISTHPRLLQSTPAEDWLVDSANKFAAAMRKKNGGSSELFICPPNEYGVKKFLSTFLVPTKASFGEFYNFRSCATFLSGYLQYEALSPLNSFPDFLPSTYSIIKLQMGNSFDLSLVLVSFLLGAGYDAYCVCGTAPASLALGSGEKTYHAFDTTKMSNHNTLCNDYYLHSWVLVKRGTRRITEDVLIEASTGNVYLINQNPYKAVYFVWNDKNYWYKENPVDGTYFLGEPYAMSELAGFYSFIDATDGNLRNNPRSAITKEKYLDLPSPWSPSLSLNLELLQTRYSLRQHPIWIGLLKYESFSPSFQV